MEEKDRSLIPVEEISERIKSKECFVEIFALKVEMPIIAQGGYYLPPKKYLTWEFIRGVLDGSKKLIKVKQLSAIYELPRLKEINCQYLWNKIRHSPELSQYYPTSTQKYPSKAFLVNVMS